MRAHHETVSHTDIITEHNVKRTCWTGFTCLHSTKVQTVA